MCSRSMFTSGISPIIPVAQRGVKRLGGQHQRLATARVLLKDPAFVSLDEASSSFDSECERWVEWDAGDKPQAERVEIRLEQAINHGDFALFTSRASLQTASRRILCDAARARAVAAVTISALAVASIPAAVQAQRPGAEPSVTRFSSVSLSPDGRNLVWIASGPASRGALMLAAGAGKNTPKSVTLPGADAGSISAAIWSGDSRKIAVLATSEHGTPVMFELNSDGSGVRRVALIPGAVHGPKFSPDGSRIAFLYSSPSEQSNGPTQATPRDTGVMDTHIDRQHLSTVDVSSGQMKVVSKPDLYVYEFAWSPSGKEFVVSDANGSGNNNWWVARLEAINTATGAARAIAKPTMQIAQPLWSPDGKMIAFIGGLMSDQGSTGGDLYTVPAAGGTAHDVTPNIKVSLNSFRWVGPGTVLATMASHGGSEIATVDAHTGAVAALWTADENISSGHARGLPVGKWTACGRATGSTDPR